jgi:hypothetical protein
MKAGMVRRVWRCDLNRSNRPVRTRMPGGVAGERPFGLPPMPMRLLYAIWVFSVILLCGGKTLLEYLLFQPLPLAGHRR